MTDFTKDLSGFRYVQTLRGDTLQSIALRELGSAGDWAQLAWLNDLLPPYLTDDQARVREGVLITGSTIRVPAPTAQVDASISPEEVFLTDLALVNGQFKFSNGDISLVSGRENLAQAISNRISTDHGDLIYHGTYGANLGRLVGALNGPVRAMVAASYVEDALGDENRIQAINSIKATSQGDRLNIVGEVVPITGAPLSTNTVV